LIDALLGDGQPGVDRALGLLAAFAEDQGLRTEPWLQRHGVPASLSADKPLAHLFVVGLLARLHALDRSGSLAAELLERAGGVGPVAALADNLDALPELVVRWGLARHGPVENALRAGLFDATVGGRTLAAQPDLPARLAEAGRSEALIASLLQGILRAAPPEAPFWLVRAFVRAGVWRHDAATRIAAVPFEDVRLLAYRLGLLASHYCRGTAAWIAAAEALCAVAPADGPHAWALEAVAPGMQLTFDPRAVQLLGATRG
jgi:hypothetical protein